MQDCANICNGRNGCTGFEYAEGPSAHGACGTYTGGRSNFRQDENRLSAGSNWRSCMKRSALICPPGFEAVSVNLDGVGKRWAYPHPYSGRTMQDCANICNGRNGCTGFEYAEGPSAHGACGTYTGGTSNFRRNENRLSAGSNWRSCMKR